MKKLFLATAVLLLGALLSQVVYAYNFPCFPKVASPTETGTNLRWSIVKDGPSWIAWDCPGVSGPVYVASDNWPLDFTTTVAVANAMGWPAMKLVAVNLPGAKAVAPAAAASAASSK